MNTFTTRILKTSMNAGAFALTALTTLTALTALSAPVADAAAPDDLPRLVVTYDVRSLATDRGAQALYRRLQGAARHVCPDASPFDLAGRATVDRCRQESLARAVRQIDSARLAAVASGTGSRS